MIKNIVFDLGNVIVDLNYDAAFAPLGVDTEKFEKIYHTDFFHAFEKGEVNEKEFFEFFCRNSDFNCDDIPELKSTLHRSFPLRQGIWEMIYDLRSKYRLFMLSNTNILDFSSLERQFDIRDPFDLVYLSYEQGHRKPDAETWQHAEMLMGINSAETLFLDDRPENIDSAQKHGWHCIQVTSENQIYESLRQWNILTADPMGEKKINE